MPNKIKASLLEIWRPVRTKKKKNKAEITRKTLAMAMDETLEI